jgi:hypothetical protein
MSRFAAATALLAALPIAAAHAQEQRLVTWNIGGAERTPAEVETSVENLASRIGPINVLVLQEVVAEEQVEAAARALEDPHWVISDFSPPPNKRRSVSLSRSRRDQPDADHRRSRMGSDRPR